MSSRLNDIRDALGLESESHDAQQKAALPKIAAWLKEAADDPAIALSAAQVLFADGELVLPAVERAAKPVKALLEEEWGNLAKSAQRLLALKVLVLAASDEATMTNSGYRAIGLSASAWYALPQRQPRLRPFVDRWLKECLAPTQPDLNEATWHAPAALGKALTVPKDEALAGALNDLKAEMTAGGNAFTPEIQEKLLTVLQQQLGPMVPSRRVVEATRAVLMTWAPALVRVARDAATTGDIAWWGLARYCARRGLPYRQLASDETRRWWGAFELAQLADETQSEPCASFLVETLLELGLAPTVSKTLGEWLEVLHETLRQEAEAVPGLSETATSCIERCAVGLPVTWLRARADEPFNPQHITDATLVDLATPIPSWQWTSWLLRECMLERLLG